MATHSSILAWRIPWTGEPGRLESTGLQSQARPKRLSYIYIRTLPLESASHPLRSTLLSPCIAPGWAPCAKPSFPLAMFYTWWCMNVIPTFKGGA